jgi:ABC-type multidrug transport system fused ATPase/permease subunit
LLHSSIQGLSGGQRARVSLARALYAGNDTQVFLLDDVLAALDANVGSVVFDRLTKRLRKQKAAVVLVTNDPSLPRRCDRVILMGKVDQPDSSPCCTVIDQGKYDELLSRGRNLHVVETEKDGGASGHEAFTKALENESLESHTPLSDYTGEAEIYISAGYSGNMTITHFSPQNVFNDSSTEPSNDTIPFGFADPERQASMEICPDSCNADEMKSGCIRDIDHETTECIGIAEAIPLYNDTGMVVTGSTQDVEGIEATTGQEIERRPSKSLKSVDDQMSTGAVPISTYLSYLKAVRNPALVLCMLGSYLTVNGAQFFQQYTVAKWSEAASTGMTAAMGAPYLRSLLNAAVVVSVFLWLRSYLLMRVGLRASRFLHSKMLGAVFRAPLSFFSSTSSGTLMSRFGKELETVDRGVPDTIGSVLFCFLQIFTSIGALAGVVTPAMLLPLALVSVLYVKTMSLFRPAARDMKRAETKTRGPIYTHFGEALRGAATIRSIPGAARNWSTEHRRLTDRNLGVFYSVKALDRWLSTRLETLGNGVVLTAAIASVYLTRSGALKAGSAGWGLTQSLSITGLLTWAVRCLTDLETNMMSLMRVRELTDLESEEADVKIATTSHKGRMPREMAKGGEALEPLLSHHVHSSLAPSDSRALVKSGWPWRGNISFNNVSMRYNPSAPLVLRNINLNVPAGTTLGVVGRTGSGKSSLLLTLFRIVELEGGGTIEIDGIDIRSVDLKTLRQSLAIIPQDPTLFQGDIAYNLDATGASSAEDMWAALEASSPEMAAQFRSGDGLQTPVKENGSNLSLGQRQLICLARALLRKSRILVLDEATSSVDSKTDQEVQATIRREFVDKGVTVVTVAHRLDTVMGYDKIAVLGAGSVVEYGTPAELVSNPKGELRRLVDADRRNKALGAKTPLSSETSTKEKSKVAV